MKTLRCSNPECQKIIQYGDPLYVLPFREYVYCSPYCFARHMDLYELIKYDIELTDEYDAWWEEEENEVWWDVENGGN